MLEHVQEVFLFFLFIYLFFILAAVKKRIYIYSISYWSEVNIIIIKPQFDFLHHQEEKVLKRRVRWIFKHVRNVAYFEVKNRGRKAIIVKLWQKNKNLR